MKGRLKNLFWKSKQPDSKGNDITLSDIIRGLQYCVNQSREIATLQYVTEFKNYLDDHGKPYSQRVLIGEDGAIDIPLVCMLNHESLGLDEMEINLDITVKNMALKAPDPVNADGKTDQSESSELSYLSRTAFVVDLNSAKLEGGYSKLGLKFKFKADAPPEAISRVIEKLNAQVAAYKLPPDNKKE